MMSSDQVFRLAYISTRADGVDDAEVVDGIAIPAMAKNRRLDISGCLWISSDQFVQVLEGGERAVRSLYDEIEVDPRHCAVDLLVAESAAERRFERFSLRVIREDGPESVRSLIEAHAERRVPEHASRARNQSPMEEFAQLVYRVIDDLASWAVDPPERPGAVLA